MSEQERDRMSQWMPWVEQGRGDPVVLLHGAPGDHRMWEGTMRRLSATRRCIAPDLPGFGRSRCRPELSDLALPAQAKTLDRFVRVSVGADERVVLVLHDVGALAGLAWAARHPERVRGIVLANVAFHTDFPWHDFARLMASPWRSALFLRFVPRRAFTSTFARDFPRVSATQAAQIHDAMTTHASRHTLPRIFRAMMQPDYFAQAQEPFEAITRSATTRVVWGAEDAMIPEEYIERISAGRAHVLRDCGHWVPYVRPDALADAVLENWP